MTIQQLYDKFDSLGTAQVTLHCQTTAADIYYRGGTEVMRHPIRPEPIQVMVIPYMVSGRIVGTQAGEVDYLVLSYEGASAIFRQRAEGLKLSPNTEIKTRTMHVPVSAIQRITVHKK